MKRAICLKHFENNVFVSTHGLKEGISELFLGDQLLGSLREARFNRVAEFHGLGIPGFLDAIEQLGKLQRKLSQAGFFREVIGNDFFNFTGGRHD
jgi:hypothetical protein